MNHFFKYKFLKNGLVKRLCLTVCLGVILFGQQNAKAQEGFHRWLKGNPDSVYYEDLSEMLTLKIYTSQKYANFTIHDDVDRVSLHFKSNPTRVIGVGANYRWFGFNVGYGFSFANQGKEAFGETKHIDLQAHLRLRKFAVNFFSNTYTGHYLENSWNLLENWQTGTYLTRGDIKNSTYGVNINYIFNFNRYSNRATFIQTDWQKKSSGSFVAGGSLFYNGVRGDSALIPTNLIDSGFFRGYNYSRSGYYALGANAGYAFTLVVFQHWFANLSLNGGLAFGRTSIYTSENHELSAYKINLNLVTGLGVGYNSKYLSIGFSYTGFQAMSPSPVDQTGIGFDTGRYRFSVAYRFKIGHESAVSQLFSRSKSNKT